MYEDGQEVLSYSAKSGEDSLGVGTAVEGMPEGGSVNVAEGEGELSGAVITTERAASAGTA